MGTSLRLGLVCAAPSKIDPDAHFLLRQMSAWLGRPHLIDQKNSDFKFPTLRLDSSPDSNLLSPFAHIALQGLLARRVTQHLREGLHHRDYLTVDQVVAIEDECENFINELPAVFRLESPDLSLDEDHPYYISQRCQLHVVIHLTQLDFLKPYLTRSPRDVPVSHDSDFRHMGIDLSLKLLQAGRRLFDHEFPINTRFHLAVFAIFDTATILCSAIIHDIDKSLPRRDEVMDAIDGALDMLHQLSLTTKIGASSYSFLSKLVLATPELSRHAPIRKRQKMGAAADRTPAWQDLTGPSVPSADYTPSSALTDARPVTQAPTAVDLSLESDQFLQDFFGTSSSPYIGGQAWDWDHLNLDAFVNLDPVVTEP